MEYLNPPSSIINDSLDIRRALLNVVSPNPAQETYHELDLSIYWRQVGAQTGPSTRALNKIFSGRKL